MTLVNTKFKPRLLIIGEGKNFFALEKYVRDKNMQKYIKFSGYLNNPYQYIKKTKILILTSKFEGLPNILIEAQFFKKYIISTDCPTGPKEILLNGLAGDLIKIGDYKKLAFLINNFYKNKKDISKKINIGSKYFNRFDYQKNCKEYLNFVLNNF